MLAWGNKEILDFKSILIERVRRKIHSHKLFLKAGGYGLEFDLNADPLYDANGLGRIHRAGAPGAICLSCPCPAEPNFTVDIPPIACSLCAAIPTENGWEFGAESGVQYELSTDATTDTDALCELLCKFTDGREIKESYTVDENGVSITVGGDGTLGYVLPAFCFDGANKPVIEVGQNALTVAYDGWICRYTTDGTILDLHQTAANRNGHYNVFLATAENDLHLHIEIVKA